MIPIQPSQAKIGDEYSHGDEVWQPIESSQTLEHVRYFRWSVRRVAYEVRAALLTAIGEPLELVTLKTDGPSYGQVLVRIIASGICGAQLQEIVGQKGDPNHLPHPLGHEAVGIVEQVGVGVTTVKVDDKVVCHWRCGAGIESDFPVYEFGKRRINSGKICTFMSHAVLSENRVTAVPFDAPDELCVLLGCSLSTALGTMEHEAKLKMGESVLIIGCGGLGLNLIMAAKMMGASLITVLELEKTKEKAARSVGANYFNSMPLDKKWAFDVVIDTTGNSEAINGGCLMIAPSGRLIMVGQPKPGEYVKIEYANHLFQGDGKTIMATQGGRFSPSQDIPRYINAWRSGHLKVDGIVTHRFALAEINEAIALVRAGQAGRVIVTP